MFPHTCCVPDHVSDHLSQHHVFPLLVDGRYLPHQLFVFIRVIVIRLDLKRPVIVENNGIIRVN